MSESVRTLYLFIFVRVCSHFIPVHVVLFQLSTDQSYVLSAFPTMPVVSDVICIDGCRLLCPQQLRALKLRIISFLLKSNLTLIFFPAVISPNIMVRSVLDSAMTAQTMTIVSGGAFLHATCLRIGKPIIAILTFTCS